MSTDSIALFDNTSETASAELLLETLSINVDFAAALIDRYRNRWGKRAWELDPAPETGQQTLWGPGGFAIHFRAQTVVLYHMMPFSSFTGDVWCRDALRQACHFIADVVGSASVIYTHELMPYQGDDLHGIADWLQTHIGPPATSFSELHDADYYGPRAWYIEAFDRCTCQDQYGGSLILCTASLPLPPNPPMQSTPLRFDKIVAILTFRCGQTSFQSIRAARLMGNPLG